MYICVGGCTCWGGSVSERATVVVLLSYCEPYFLGTGSVLEPRARLEQAPGNMSLPPKALGLHAYE